MENFWVKDNQIIFKPDFNEPINKYQREISNCNGLIFGNYDKLEIILETNNKFKTEYYRNYKESKFNQKIIYYNFFMMFILIKKLFYQNK